ncbi:MAG: hypothetical protein RI907_36, partial [Pseudomonadota bacterium]
MFSVPQTSGMGTPTLHPRFRAAAEWLSLASLLAGLLLSSSGHQVLHWLGLFAMAGGTLLAWFSHVSMRAELARAEADAHAWRSWQQASEDTVVVLGAPRGGWANWSPRHGEADGPVVLQANTRNMVGAHPAKKPNVDATSTSNAAAPSLAQLWSPDALAPLLDTVYQLRSAPDTSTAEGQPLVRSCEVALHDLDKAHASWWQHRVLACGDRVIVQSQNITPFRAAQRALHEREAFYRTLVDSLPMGVLARSTQPQTAGRYLVCNRYASDVLKVPAEQLLGTKGEQVLPEAWIQQSIEQDLQVLREPRMHRFEGLCFPTRSGDRILDLIKTPVYDADGDIDHILVIAQDVTEQRQAADQLR